MKLYKEDLPRFQRGQTVQGPNKHNGPVQILDVIEHREGYIGPVYRLSGHIRLLCMPIWFVDQYYEVV